MSDTSGAAGAHSGNGRPDARVVTGGDGDGLAGGLTVGLRFAADWVAGALDVAVGAARLGSVEDDGVAAGMHPDSATTTVANIAATGARI